MIRSIRWRFTVTFISLMALAVFATWFINTFCLENYYQNYKVRLLEQAYTSIDEIVKEERARGESALEGLEEELSRQYSIFSAEDGVKESGSGASKEEESVSSGTRNLAYVVRQLRDTSNITLLIYDSIRDKTLISSARDIDILRDRVRQYIVGRNGAEREILREHDNFMIQKTFDPRTHTFFLESWGFFSDNGTIFIMTTPLASIEESVRISNRFLMYVGMAVILVSGVILSYATKRITSPIHELSELSEKMSELDFDAKYQDDRHSTEELSILGNSMNVLSDKLRETIEKLTSANNRLQRDIEEKIQIDEMRKEFIANVSHELKTPIALIQGYAEGLTEGMAEEQESRDYYCEVIMDEANKMNKMVKQLLTLTALEFGNEQAVIERFNLTDLIRGVISSAGILLQQKQITVDFQMKEAVFVRADEFQIEEVVTNYMNNAINHVEGERLIRIGVQKRDGRACVAVFNTGENIPEDDIKNLWTKFYKVDKARTRAYGGSGIGLSIVKAIMEAHNQEYGVRNLENGVEFWFTLQCAEEEAKDRKGDEIL